MSAAAAATPDEQPASTRVQRGVAARVALLKGIIELTPDTLRAFAEAAAREPAVVRTFGDLSAAELAAEVNNPQARAQRHHDNLLARDTNLDRGVVAPHPEPPKDPKKLAEEWGMAEGYEIEHHATVNHDLPIEVAQTWLRNYFFAALGRDLPAGPMKAAARRAGFSDDTLDRARRREQVEWVRVGRAYAWKWTKDTP